MKKKNKFAAIDIGSHNCRLLIVEKKDSKLRIHFNSATPTNLIKNLSFNNEFNFKNISKTVDCLKKFKKKMEYFNVSGYRCIATEACRSVTNPEFFVHQAKEKSGIDVEIISADEEARLSLLSCKKYTEKIKFGLLFDIGGGSTELTFFNFIDKPFSSKSCSLSFGVINLSEKNEIYGPDYNKKLIQRYVNDFYSLFKNDCTNFSTIGSCSTMTTICSVYLNLPFYSPKKIEGIKMNINDVKKTIKLLKSMSKDQLRNHPCIRGKYALLMNGIEILSEIIEIIPTKNIIVTNKGLRDAIVDEITVTNEN